MFFLSDNIKKGNRIEFLVYNSLEDVSQRVDWQDILDPLLTILDEEGRVYAWDNTKEEEVGTVFNYSFKTVGTDLNLGEKCKAKFLQLGQPHSFEIEIND